MHDWRLCRWGRLWRGHRRLSPPTLPDQFLVTTSYSAISINTFARLYGMGGSVSGCTWWKPIDS